jgi:prefoldin subunit 5
MSDQEIFDKMADEIDMLEDRIEELEAENAKLREKLQEIADRPSSYDAVLMAREALAELDDE